MLRTWNRVLYVNTHEMPIYLLVMGWVGGSVCVCVHVCVNLDGPLLWRCTRLLLRDHLQHPIVTLNTVGQKKLNTDQTFHFYKGDPKFQPWCLPPLCDQVWNGSIYSGNLWARSACRQKNPQGYRCFVFDLQPATNFFSFPKDHLRQHPKKLRMRVLPAEIMNLHLYSLALKPDSF